jgi:peptidoglycan/LPS O-acetylase OafA/YrhL/lysophospholipase L1-like esterase
MQIGRGACNLSRRAYFCRVCETRTVTAMRFAYRPGLVGVRALAVIAVLAFNDGRLDGGFLGVSTFFTVSGFLITSLLLTERARSGRVSLRAFYARRARRLLPAAFAGIVIAAVVAVMVGDARTAENFRADGVAALFNLANWRFLAAGHSYVDLFAAPSPLQHYWSLAVEEQFYLLLAPLLAGVFVLARGRAVRIGAALGALAALSFADGWIAVRHGVDRAYYGTDTRALEFLVGALAAVWLARRPHGQRGSRVAAAVGVVALAGMVWATTMARTDQSGLFRGGLLLFAIGSTALVVAACEPGPVRALCSWRPLRWIGMISYGIYVFHWPVFVWLTPGRTGESGLRLTMLRVGCTLAIAVASFFWLERPIREGRRLAGRKPWVIAPASALVCVAAALVVGVGAGVGPPAVNFAPVNAEAAVIAPPSTRAVPSTVPVTTTTTIAVAADTAQAPPPATQPIARPPAPPAPVTTVPPAPQPKRLLVVGDSVALTLGRGIERWGQQRGVSVLNAGKLGCTLLDGAKVRGYWGVQDRPADACGTRSDWASRLTMFQPDLVVVMFGAWDVYDASWDGTWHAPGDSVWNAHYQANVTDAAQRLRASGANVVWLAPPCFAASPGSGDQDEPWFDPARIDVLTNIYRSVAGGKGIRLTDVTRKSGCPVDLSVRPDGVHYSDAGADRVAGELGPLFDAEIRR